MAAGQSGATCEGCGVVFEERAGILRFMTADRIAKGEPFQRQYQIVRERDGYRTGTPEYYRMLPIVPRGDPRAEEWRIRRESYAHLQQHVLPAVWQEPIRILDLAHDLIRLSVAGGSKDIQLTVTGLRPGEKLEETLFAPDEEPIPTDYEVLLVARERTPHAQEPARQLALRLEALAGAGAEDELRRELSGGRTSVSLAKG